MQQNALSDLYEAFTKDLYNSCEEYKKGMFNTIIEA